MALALADAVKPGLYLPGRAVMLAGFRVDLLRGAAPAYALQPVTMFVTYAFLHAGLAHLLVNMATLWSLGREVLARVGPVRFVALFLAGAIGGGVAYALLAPSTAVMVGASGSLFALAGVLLFWAWADRPDRFARLRFVLRWTAILVVFHVVMWWLLNGRLAWEAHLGGLIVGLALAPVMRRRAGA